MVEFNYIIETSIDVPETITVKGKKIVAEIDDTWSGEIEYSDEKYSEEQTSEIGIDLDYYWSIRMKPDNHGKFTITLKVNGDEIASDSFYPDNITVAQMLDRFVETLEEYI
jgi:hypothetical protein